MKIYAVVFLLFVLSNLGYWFYVRSKLWVIAYDFSSGIYLTFLMVAYWNPQLKQNMSIYHILAYIAIIAFEIYITVWAKIGDLGIKIPEMNEFDIDLAKALSLIFSAPAYITGGLLCCDIAAKHFSLINS